MIRVTWLLALSLTILSGCAPSYRHIPLTAEGKNVILVASELPVLIPGRPLDRCAVLNYVQVLELDYTRLHGYSDIDNALRNKAAKLNSNIIVRLNYDRAESAAMLGVVGAHGLALKCPDDVLKASGLKDHRFYTIEEVDCENSNVQGAGGNNLNPNSNINPNK